MQYEIKTLKIDGKKITLKLLKQLPLLPLLEIHNLNDVEKIGFVNEITASSKSNKLYYLLGYKGNLYVEYLQRDWKVYKNPCRVSSNNFDRYFDNSNETSHFLDMFHSLRLQRDTFEQIFY